ncbi:hypothetical protein NEOLEDRAFT_567688 [Neolentinus lepideus HHB14362 ss-1]|uniref:Uncharacterized protein n=1 Tax=Neolentinus lepideus HHB14362 ss-1 TaxID=1314782 RepID=A0A165QZ26_9AGAM|nr:hypothetical protein NEOLEDRAFT_567688 [Neolentinus lepideus HHB14362 ss-1]
MIYSRCTSSIHAMQGSEDVWIGRVRSSSGYRSDITMMYNVAFGLGCSRVFMSPARVVGRTLDMYHMLHAVHYHLPFVVLFVILPSYLVTGSTFNAVFDFLQSPIESIVVRLPLIRASNTMGPGLSYITSRV